MIEVHSKKNPYRKLKIVIVGSGVMGQALMQGFTKNGMLAPSQITVIVRSKKGARFKHSPAGIHYTDQYPKNFDGTSLIFLCVKPHQIKKVCESLSQSKLSSKTTVVSIAAGVTLKMLEEFLPAKTPLIRAMPNTPCRVGEGLTVLCSNPHVSSQSKKYAQDLFSQVGLCLETEESYFNAITALSGSGPAYHLLIMEALIDGGVRVGLPRELALKIVTQVTLGTAQLLKTSERHPAALRDEVTTPGGCTIAALLVLEDGKIRSVLARAVEEATQTVVTLAQEKKSVS